MQLKRRSAYLIPWLMDFAAMLVVFKVGREMAETHRTMWEMGLVGAVASLSLGASSLVFGRLSDRVGQRRLMVLGSLLLLVCPLLAGRSAYYLTYFILGIGSGMVYPALVSWLTMGRGAEQAGGGMSRALIGFCLSWNLGVMAAQLSGGWLYEMDHNWPLLAAAVLFLFTIATVLAVRRPDAGFGAAPASTERRDHQADAAAFSRLAWIANLGSAFSISMIIHLFPKLAVELEVPASQHGEVLGTMRFVVIGVYVSMHLLTFWRFRFGVALASQALAVVGLLLLSTATNVVQLWIALAALAQLGGFNYFASLYYSTSGSAEEQRGAASGMHEATLAIGFASGSALGGLVGHWLGVRAPYLMGACLIIVLGFVQVRVYAQQVRKRQSHAGVM